MGASDREREREQAPIREAVREALEEAGIQIGSIETLDPGPYLNRDQQFRRDLAARLFSDALRVEFETSTQGTRNNHPIASSETLASAAIGSAEALLTALQVREARER